MVKRIVFVFLLFPILYFSCGAGSRSAGLSPNSVSAQSSLSIGAITVQTPGNIEKYAKFEVSFQISNTTANDFFLPYDPSPPAEVIPEQGISVDAQFISPSGETFQQPAFYYQDFDYQQKSGQDWIYPNGNFFWKVRFSPNKVGIWQFRIIAKDENGTMQSPTQTFNVIESESKGFIKVSKSDPRYFEYDDGSYFPALGYNMNWDHIKWDNPVIDNQANFQKMGANGIQLIRMWLSQWSIFASQDSTWQSATGAWKSILSNSQSVSGNDVSFALNWNWNPGIFLGWMKRSPAVKPNTTYHVTLKYLIPKPLSGPRISGYPYGFAAKIGGWLAEDLVQLADPCATRPSLPWGLPECNVVTNYAINSPTNPSGIPQWSTLEGRFTTKSNANFMDHFYLVLENVNNPPNSNYGADAYIDKVEIREDLGNGQFGENIISTPFAAQHQYFDQRYSFAFDKALDLAEQYGVYLKPVILEKNEYIQQHFDFDGNPIPDNSLCYDSDPNNNPPKCPGNNWFYGNWRTETKIRWFQKAWWRYLQARWGYSPNIHTWELLNEGDPYNGLHYTQADELSKYMHCGVFGIPTVETNGWKCNYDHPNDHLVTTSFWHSFPTTPFWQNSNYPNLDYADVHLYIYEGITNTLRVDKPTTMTYINILDPADYYDAASATQKLSMQIGAKQYYGVGKPVMRGETGFVTASSNDYDRRLFQDIQGVWVHNYVWGQLNSGGLIESYWYENTHIYNSQYNFDHRPHFGAYYKFIKDIPLNNGNYQEASATAPNTNIRIWGQKDLVNQKAHLWIQNKNHTWKNVIDGINISPQTTTITVPGFIPNQQYQIEWWDTYQGISTNTSSINSDQSGNLLLPINNLQTDLAVKIISPSQPTPTPSKTPTQGVPTGTPPPSPTPTPSCSLAKQGDVNCDNNVNILDLVTVLSNFGRLGTGVAGDVNGDGTVNILDLVTLLGNFGKVS